MATPSRPARPIGSSGAVASARPDLRRGERGSARGRLLDAAVDLIRRRGFAATSVDEVCRAAGVTKGAFFHHFASKQALAVAVAEHWGAITTPVFAAADFHDRSTAADRVLGYLDLRAAMIQGEPAAYTCVAGTMVQEAYATSREIRDACAATILGHAATLEDDLRVALADAGQEHVDPASLARHVQAVLQGAFVLAKAADDATMATDSIAHLKRYVEHLTTPPAKEKS